MNITQSPRFRRAAAWCSALVLGLTAAQAQTIFLTFSGGGGTPLSIAWSTPIAYTITATPNPGTKDPYFVFNEVAPLSAGNPSSLEQAVSATGAPSYSGNGDATFTINSISWGESSHNSINSLNDVKFRRVPAAGVNSLDIGDVFTLTAGTLTTVGNFTGTLPTNGNYSTFIMDASYTFLGSGSAIPEPSTYAAIMGLGALGFVAWRRRRREKPVAMPADTAAT